MTNRSNKYFPSFIPLNLEFSPRLRVIDNFSDYISFNVCNKEMVLESFSSSSIAIITSNVSIKNNVTTSISHMHIYNKPITKIIYYMVHITSTEAELFAIRCSINQTTNFNNIFKIIIITNSIYTAKNIFKLSVHLYQVQSATILSNLCNFFNCCENNSIEFWECPSHLR